MQIEKGFWKNKKVLLTGHTGFKGSWLTILLSHLEAHVLGFSLPAEKKSLFNKTKILSLIEHEIGDIRNLDHLIKVEKNFSPDILIHMAAQPLVIRSYEDPIETFSTNVMGTVNVLEVIRQSKTITSGVIITTDKCYENKNLKRGYKETDPMGGYDPYSSSKGSAELIISSYQRSFFSQSNNLRRPAIAPVRAGNVIGGGDYAKNRLIPDLIRSIGSLKPINIRSPQATRPWQHVLEPLSGYLLVAQKLSLEGPSSSHSWNFGPRKSDIKPVSYIAELFCQLWGEGLSWVSANNSGYHEAENLSLDISKAKSSLGWKPKWNLEQAVGKVVAWHKADMKKEDLKKISLKQIKEYLSD